MATVIDSKEVRLQIARKSSGGILDGGKKPDSCIINENVQPAEFEDAYATRL